MIPNNIVRDSDSWFFTVDSLQFQLCELICMLSIFFSLLPGWLNCSRLKARPAFRTTSIEMKLSKKMQNLWPAGYGKITHLAGLSFTQSLDSLFWKVLTQSGLISGKKERGKYATAPPPVTGTQRGGLNPELIISYFLWKPVWFIPTYRTRHPFLL